MDIIQVGIETLSKSSKTEPWKMTFKTPVDGVRMTMNLDKVEVGPRFREVLSTIEKHQFYPRTITGEELENLGMTTRDSFTVKMLSSVPAHVEIGFRTFRQFRNPNAPTIRGKHEEYRYKPEIKTEEELSLFSIGVPTKSNFETAVVNLDYLLVGKIDGEVTDGDTINFKIERAGMMTRTDKNLEEGKTIKVRLAGLNTPETKKDYTTDDTDRNEEYIKQYGIQKTEDATAEDIAFSIGEEAKNSLKSFLGGDGYVVLDVDATVGGSPKRDPYKRYVAAVYKTSFTNADEVLYSGGFNATVVNKQMLGTFSKIATNAPLAIPYTYFIDNEYSRLPAGDWLYELGIRSYDDVKIGDKIKIEDAKEAPSVKSPLTGGETVEVKYKSSGSNQIEFMEPYDDRFKELFPNEEVGHKVRIGDVMLTIPPLSIEVNRVGSLRKIKTLRSKSSMLIKGGSSATTITLQLYFHDLDSINGRKVKQHPDTDRYYYMDGLRPLIAQFKKAPFVPIDNVYINETLGIDSVALVNLSIQTVPGFPHSIAANLVLAKFDHSAYMPQISRLGLALNYPMLRWYYQEPMNDTKINDPERSPYRTWLHPIPESGLTNDFTFLKASKEHLEARKQAIQDLRRMTNPLIAEERFFNPTTKWTSGGDGSDANTMRGKEFKDGKAAQKVIDQYNRTQKIKKEGRWPKLTPNERGGFSDEDLISYTNFFKAVHPKIMDEIYGEGKYSSDSDIKGVSHYAPYGTAIHQNETQQKAMGETIGTKDYWPASENGSIRIRLYSQKNIDLFSEDYFVEKDGELYTYVIPGKDIQKLNQIVQRGKAAETAYLTDIADWNATKAVIEQTEGHIPLDPVEIGGTLIPTGLSVMYENQFSNIQLQALDGPSFQFLGGQDPYIQVSFEADDEAVKDLREMLEETEYFAREYRTGITSGFLGVENHLMQLFGVETVMPETVQIRTVQGFPGRYTIDMTLCGFDKTQKRTEQLEGISPIYGDKVPNREEREVSNVEETADASIIEFKMRNLELYPDLELPTYNELIESLPYMNANCTVYENRTGGIYVDPDFYMATPQTLREIIRQSIYDNPKGHALQLKDFTGVEMTTSSIATNPLDGDAGMWDILNEVDSRTSRVPSNFSWSGDASDSSGGASNAEGLTFASKEVEEYVKDRNKLKEPPAFEQWIAWGKGTTYDAYEKWKSELTQPEEWQVYNEIYKWVDELWVKNKKVYNDKNVETTSTAWQKIVYAASDDLWDAEWNQLAKDKPELLKDNQKEEHKTKISAKDYKNGSNNMVPRERVANIIKAIAHVRSRWTQFTGANIPKIDGQGNACGIMGIPLSSEGTDFGTAQRLLWDWKFNIEKGIKFLYEAYEAALAQDDLWYKCRPWEWMIAAYATGTVITDGKARETLENSFWQQTTSILQNVYTGYEVLYATPTTPMNIRIMQERNGYDSHEMGVIKGEKGALIKELLDNGWRRLKHNNWVRKDEYYSKSDSKKWLEEQNAGKVKEIYDKWAKEQYDTADPYKNVSGSNASISIAMNESMSREKNRKENKSGAEMYDEYREATDYIDNTIGNRLVSSQMPQDVFPEMFTDMINYDHRMRLVRAFPTFQMFIVDEGKWMTNYRLWDNLYGYNAIQSIDIHKSRKIAADTVVITMTNVYSNLTSRAVDTTYEEWDYKFWDNLVFGNPNEKILEARKEMLNSLLLQTGARIHLRLGYGSSATDLPVVFNGTITEMNANEIVEIVAQGDGIELGNVISGDPDDDNKSLLKGVTEPRDLICELLTSKGNWFKDVINYKSDGALFKDNPLGIMHFGQPPGAEAPPGNLSLLEIWRNSEYGESGQNVYSSNGVPTFSQWSMPDGTDIPWSFDTPMLKWLQPGDEQNVVIPFYNNTPWDVFQTLAYVSPDYICAVHPFEMRSTLFFGKPYWAMAYRYDSRYEYDVDQKAWIRLRDLEHRKPYAQFHLFDSNTDIIGNSIKASEEGVYTAVITNYDGKQVGPMYADFDIRFDKQKTTVLDAQIMSRVNGMDFWTSEKQSMYYGMSALRDYMKDMYKGELIVLGDPTIKPHDVCYMNDKMYDMHGNFMVKAVTHSFSHETGFITHVQPDALVINDDLALLSVSNWGLSALAKFSATLLGFAFGSSVIKKLIPSAVAEKAMLYGTMGAKRAADYALAGIARNLPDSDPEVKHFKNLLKGLRKIPLDDPRRDAKIKEVQDYAKKLEDKLKQWDADGNFSYVKDGKTVKVKGLKSLANTKRTISAIKQTSDSLTKGAQAFKLVRGAGMALLGANPLSLLAAGVVTWATETIAEKYRRKKAMMQCVLMMPLQYQGRQYTAGINGHRGMVVGDAMGKIDSFLSGMGADGENGNGDWEWAMDTWNWLTDAEGKDYSVTEEELRDGSWKNTDDEGSYWTE
jgi:endonuclease YncB( thermonuclease family)